jgi:hypothetical protein
VNPESSSETRVGHAGKGHSSVSSAADSSWFTLSSLSHECNSQTTEGEYRQRFIRRKDKDPTWGREGSRVGCQGALGLGVSSSMKMGVWKAEFWLAMPTTFRADHGLTCSHLGSSRLPPFPPIWAGGKGLLRKWVVKGDLFHVMEVSWRALIPTTPAWFQLTT